MPKTIRSHIPTDITIDGDPVRIDVKRLNISAFEEYQAAYFEFSGRTVRGTDDPAAAEREWLPEDKKKWQGWLDDVFRDYVAIPEGEFVVEDAELTLPNGAMLLAYYGGRADVVGDVLSTIWLENRLPEILRKNLKSARDLPPGSASAPATEGGGETPAPTAAPADASSTAPIAAATASSGDASSLSTVPSDSTPVLSEA